MGKFFKTAKTKSKFQILQDNKVPLTPEERTTVFERKAVWHYGFSKHPITGRKVQQVSAIWKTINPRTKEVTYVTNTHRAYNTAPTLKGAIERYHKFIKETA